MKVVFLNPIGRLGGAETSLLSMLASIVRHGGIEAVLIAGQDGPLIERARQLGVPARVVPMPDRISRLGDSQIDRGANSQWRRIGSLLGNLVLAGGETARYTYRLRCAIAEEKPSLLHTNGLKMHLLGAAARPAHCPMLWHIHDYIGPRALMRTLLGLSVKRCSGFIVNSDSVGADLRAALRSPLPIYRLYNAIDTTHFHPDGPALDLDALSGLGPAPVGTIRVGLPATFARWKGHAVFLNAIAMLRDVTPIRAYIIGDALYQTDGSQYSRQELLSLIEALGLRGHVGLTGFVADPAAAMRSLDIVAHTSTQPEPFGMVLIEAMACGKAVIASNAGGAAEIVDETTARVHAPGNVDELAGRIRELAADVHLRTTLGRAARIKAERDFDARRLAGELLSIYKHTLSKGTGGSLVSPVVSPSISSVVPPVLSAGSPRVRPFEAASEFKTRN